MAMLLVALVAGVCRATVGNADFYLAALHGAHAYQRTYDAVLTAPGARKYLPTRSGGLPRHSDELIALELTELVPHAAFERAARHQAAELAGYLAGDRAGVSLSAWVQPLVDSVTATSRHQMDAVIEHSSREVSRRLVGLVAEWRHAMAEVRHGRPAAWAGHPRQWLHETVDRPFADFVTQTWKQPEAGHIHARLGPVVNALADYYASLYSPAARAAGHGAYPVATLIGQDIRARLTGRGAAEPAVFRAALRTVRPFIAAACSPWALPAGVLGAVLAFAASLRAARGRGRTRPLLAAGRTCGGAAVLAALAGGCAWMVSAPSVLVPRRLPPAAASLLTDVANRLYGGLALAWWCGAGVLALAAVALLAASHSPRPARCCVPDAAAREHPALLCAGVTVLRANPAETSQPTPEVLQAGAGHLWVRM